jgi:hypothetical protein
MVSFKPFPNPFRRSLKRDSNVNSLNSQVHDPKGPPAYAHTTYLRIRADLLSHGIFELVLNSNGPLRVQQQLLQFVSSLYIGSQQRSTTMLLRRFLSRKVRLFRSAVAKCARSAR